MFTGRVLLLAVKRNFPAEIRLLYEKIVPLSIHAPSMFEWLNFDLWRSMTEVEPVTQNIFTETNAKEKEL